MVNARRERIDILDDIAKLRIQIAKLQAHEEELLSELRGTVVDPVAKLLNEREMADCEKLYKYVTDNYKWRIKSVKHAEDKARSIQIITFHNEETQETISFDPMANLNKFADFVNTHGIASSNVYHITPARAIEVSSQFNNGVRWKLEIFNKLMLVNLGSLGFMALANNDIVLAQHALNTLPTYNITYHGMRVVLLNYQYIKTLSENSIHGNIVNMGFSTPLEMVNFLKAYLPKRSSNILLTKLTIYVKGTFYTYKYTGKSGSAQALYMISLEDDIGYHGYRTWMLTRNEFLTYKAMVRGYTRMKDVVVNTIESK